MMTYLPNFKPGYYNPFPLNQPPRIINGGKVWGITIELYKEDPDYIWAK